jgi:hypothetical protein
MVDFGQPGNASLWKSLPLFSTGTTEAELMVRELRVEPAAAQRAMWLVPTPSMSREVEKRSWS